MKKQPKCRSCGHPERKHKPISNKLDPCTVDGCGCCRYPT